MKKMFFTFTLIALFLFTAILLLNTFLFSRVYQEAETPESVMEDSAFLSTAEMGENSFVSDRVSVTLTEYEYEGTAVYAAKVETDDPSLLKTAFAQSAYGKNLTATTSEIAGDVDAILAINGDYYGVQEKGYVLKNGVLYRSTPAEGREDLVIWSDGSFSIITETDISAEELLEKGAVQILSFGPALLEDGEIQVSAGEEVGKAKASNPRTAIGIDENGAYYFVVSDGRTEESEGLSLSELAEFMKELGCVTAYNLDGGGSSTMVFLGRVVNNPTTGGGRIKERSVSDAVYIG